MAYFGQISPKNRLKSAALSYLYMGYSVIPINGDSVPKREKVAAVSWKPYQSRRATEERIHTWFTENDFGGVAIVTGNISGLVVLDFDDSALAHQFAMRYPSLTQTFTVRSAGRNLPHYYYRLPPHMSLRSRRCKGVDLLSDNRYVIAPPTSIQGDDYKIVRGGQPQTLTNAHIRIIEAFLSDLSPEYHAEQETPRYANSRTLPPLELHTQQYLSPQDAISLYRHYAPEGRNDALFRVAIKARDNGWTQSDTEAILADVHANEQSGNESLEQRHREALATIESAFSRPARKPKSDAMTQQLPTNLREELLSQSKTALLRVLDGLLLNNVTQGTLLTEKMICTILHNQVGRYSIRQALAASYPDNTPIFAESDPFPKPQSHTHVASAIAGKSNNKCLLFRETPSDKSNMGRPAKHFVMPDIETLCAKFGVKAQGTDAIEVEDIASPKQYRMALHRNFIKRRSGTYTTKWLAQRLSVSKRTIQRYRQDKQIKCRPTYHQRLITWETLNYVPEASEQWGVFLQDGLGKRYPAQRDVAKNLLGQKKTILLMQQTGNAYWHVDNIPSPVMLTGVSPQSRKNESKSRFAAYREYVAQKSLKTPQIAVKPDAPKVAAAIISSAEQDSVPMGTVKSNEAKASKPKPKRYYRKELADNSLENAAMRLYRKTAQLCQEKIGYLSRQMARRLTEQYGVNLVKRLVQVLSWREGIENPAGFSVVWLRSEAKRAQLKLAIG